MVLLYDGENCPEWKIIPIKQFKGTACATSIDQFNW